MTEPTRSYRKPTSAFNAICAVVSAAVLGGACSQYAINGGRGWLAAAIASGFITLSARMGDFGNE